MRKSLVGAAVLSLLVLSSWVISLADEPKAHSTQHIFFAAGIVFPSQRHAVRHFLIDPAAQIFIEGNEVGYSILGSGFDFPRLDIIFVDPNGRRIDPKHLPDDPSVRKEAIGEKPALVIDNPPPGQWTLEVTLPEREKEKLIYFVDVFAKNATYSIASSLDRRIIKPNESVRAEIRVERQGEPYPDATVTGTLGKRMTKSLGGSLPPVTFHDDGTEGDSVSRDAVYTAIVSPGSLGSYDIHFEVTDGKNFQRIGSLDTHVIEAERK